MTSVSFVDLRRANAERQKEWCPDPGQQPDLSFRGNELAGEVGEACNIVKKLERERHGWAGSRASIGDLAEEIADMIICADLLALAAGISAEDLMAAVVGKFNAVSEARGFRTRLAGRANGLGDPAQMQTDIGLLLATIDFLAEATGEGPEGEDVALVEQIRRDHERRAAILSAGSSEPNYWGWWAGPDEERCTIGPCASREEVIAAAQAEAMGEFQDDDGAWKLGFWICEAEKRPLRLAEWIEADQLLERAEETLADSDRVGCDGDDGPWFEATVEQEADFRKRIAAACDEWQAAHGLVFTCMTFSNSRKHERVVCERPLPSGEA